MLLGLALPRTRRRAWLAPLTAGLVAIVLANAGHVSRMLHSSALEQLAQRWLTPPVAATLTGLAVVLFLWSLYLLVAPDDANRKLARRLARNGDHRGAAQLFLKAGKTSKALAEFQKAHAWLDAANVSRQMGRTAEAASFYKAAGGEHLEEAARLYASSGDTASAKSCYEGLARWYADRGRLGEAVTAWMRAGEPARAARTARLALERGHVNTETGEFKAARRAAEAVRDHELRARLEEAQGNYEGAAAAWAAAGKPRLAAEGLIRLGRFEEAATLLAKAGLTKEATRLLYRAERRLAEQAGRTTGDRSRELNAELERLARRLLPALEREHMEEERVEVLLHLGRVDEAVGILLAQDRIADAADVASQYERWELAASLMERLGRWGEAGDMYELAGAFQEAARCAERAGENDRALHLYRKAGDLSGAAACLARGGDLQQALKLLCEAGKPLQAWDLLREHPGPVPDIPGVILQMARKLEEEGRLQEAIACLQRTTVGVALTPDRIGAALELARYLLKAGDLRAAQAQVDRILELDYSSKETHELAAEIHRLKQLEEQRALTPAPAGQEGEEAEERYQIITELGRGGMGVVFKARDTRLERVVAIKVVRTTSPDEASQLEREAKAAATLNHPAIVTVFDFEPGLGGYLISMEYVEGESLDRLLRREPQRILSNLFPILIQTADGIAYAHAHHVIHRDLKPGNILLTASNRVKIFDFGIAARLDIERESSARVCGTPFYMSPEQIRGEEPSPSSDIYSLGATFYHLATGRPPFNRGNVIDAHLNATPPDPTEIRPGLSRELADIILRCLEKEPSKRYPSAEELHRALVGAAMRRSNVSS
ncbi:MAG TPA: serine/threonine protein kinase [Acidobacteria bacterium]|nr:serine/threonine protein kinase [Acidobacteriota bacterium]